MSHFSDAYLGSRGAYVPKRKAPVRHIVHQHTRDGKKVRSYQRGSGHRDIKSIELGMPNYLSNSRKKVIDLSKSGLSEKEINLLKRRLNNGNLSISDVNIPDGGFELDPEQIEKGHDWLKDKWKTPTGKPRSNSPFGYREENVLDPANFREIRLIDFRDLANYHQAKLGIRFYVPVYQVRASDGSSFEYNVSAGEVDLTG